MQARDPNYYLCDEVENEQEKKFNLFTKEVPNTTIKTIVRGSSAQTWSVKGSLYYFYFSRSLFLFLYLNIILFFVKRWKKIAFTT